MMLVFPQMNPVALQVGPLSVHWYGLAYVAALMFGLYAMKWLVRRYPVNNLTESRVDDLLIWVTVGVIAGGRIGYVLFYGLHQLLADPLMIVRVWEGGMSFHGGFAGVVLAILLFAQKYKIHPADIGDRVALVVPFGLLVVRLANFVNGELWGRPVVQPEDVPWAMVFPHVDALPRHPSQLYEAGLEGLVLWAVLLAFVLVRGMRRWQVLGLFCVGYAACRLTVEFFREPEIVHQLGFLAVTQGQTLSLPLLGLGLWAIWQGRKA